MHVESTCICVLIDCPRKQHGVHMCWYCACWINLLYMLNLPAFACWSNVPKMTGAHVCCSCSVLKWHMQSDTHVRTCSTGTGQHMCTLCWIPGHSINTRLHVVSACSFLECCHYAKMKKPRRCFMSLERWQPRWRSALLEVCNDNRPVFSGFSVGCCINREKVICYQLEFEK